MIDAKKLYAFYCTFGYLLTEHWQWSLFQWEMTIYTMMGIFGIFAYLAYLLGDLTQTLKDSQVFCSQDCVGVKVDSNPLEKKTD